MTFYDFMISGRPGWYFANPLKVGYLVKIKRFKLNFNQGQTDHCGNVAIAANLCFKNAWHFKNIFREL
jgi:hypothetical protein